MAPSVTCQNCGERVDAQYARVFGNEDGDVYACTSCSTHGAIANGAAVGPNRDGTRLVHRPGQDNPAPATLEDDGDEPTPSERYSLDALRDRSDPTTPSSSSERHDDAAFAALVAE